MKKPAIALKLQRGEMIDPSNRSASLFTSRRISDRLLSLSTGLVSVIDGPSTIVPPPTTTTPVHSDVGLRRCQSGSSFVFVSAGSLFSRK